jgi:hypothetical protein
MFDFSIKEFLHRTFTLYKNKNYEHDICKERNIMRFKWDMYNLYYFKYPFVMIYL